MVLADVGRDFLKRVDEAVDSLNNPIKRALHPPLAPLLLCHQKLNKLKLHPHLLSHVLHKKLLKRGHQDQIIFTGENIKILLILLLNLPCKFLHFHFVLLLGF